MKKKIYFILSLLTALALQSCLHDNTDFFGESAADRIDRLTAQDRSLLESSEGGWVLQYYTGKGYSNGGYTFLLKFKNGRASVSADFAGSDSVVTTKYEIKQDQGPVITFPVYNAIMHRLAQVTQRNVDGEQGDYEFTVVKATTDTLYLRGKKWLNDMILTRLPKDAVWKNYLDSVTKIKNEVISTYDIKVNDGDVIGSATLNPLTRRFSFSVNDQVTQTAYCYTTKGIVLQKPVKVEGREISSLEWQSDTRTFVNGNVQIVGFLPPGYKPLNFWLGTWNLHYSNTRTVPITITQGNSSNLTGVITYNGIKYTVGLTYDSSKGLISLALQDIPDPENKYGGNILFLGVSAANGNRFVQTQGAALNFTFDEATNQVKAVDNGVSPNPIDSFAGIYFGEDNQPVEENNNYVYTLVLFRITSLTR